MLRELTERGSNGITVWLLWNDSPDFSRDGYQFQVKVQDVKGEDLITIYCDTFEQAREAFHHPFAIRNSYLKSGRIETVAA